MAERKKVAKTETDKPKRTTRTQRESMPSVTPEGREQKMVSLAVDLAEKQLREGTASAAVITHYLKLASKREALEREILERQATLIEAKAKSITKDKEVEELAKEAIKAMQSYK